MQFSLSAITPRHTVQIYSFTVSKCLKLSKTYTEEFTDTINRMHAQLSSLVKGNKYSKYRWGGGSGCGMSAQHPQTSEEWHENRCGKRGRISTQTSTLQGGKKCYFLQRNCVSPLSLRSASLSWREAGITKKSRTRSVLDFTRI